MVRLIETLISFSSSFSKRELALYIGLPLYGILVLIMPQVNLGKYLWFLDQIVPALVLNPIVLIMLLFMAVVADANRDIPGLLLVIPTLIFGNIIFWVPVAYCINKLLDRKNRGD